MLYSNGDANFGTQQAQPLNSLANPTMLQGGVLAWQPPELQHALHQFIAQQVAAQIAQRQQTGANPWQSASQNLFAQQHNPLAPAPQGHSPSIAPPLYLLHHIAQSLQLLAQQLVQVAAQTSAQAAMNPSSASAASQPFGVGSQFGAGQAYGGGQQFAAGQPFGLGQAVH